MRSLSLVALVVALHAGMAGAQEEPPATWEPRAANPATAEPPAREPPTAIPTPTPTSTSTPTPTPTATPSTPEITAAASPADAVTPPRAEPSPASFPFAGPGAGDYRWQLMAGVGGAAEGAPNFVVGVGIAVGTFGGTRVDLNASLGWSAMTQDVPVQPSWNGGGQTFSSASTSARAFLFELTASRRVGAFELWAGGGAHVSIPQFEATYQETRCTDLLCLGPTYRATDTDAKIGSGAPGLLVSAGGRLPIAQHVLFAVDLRWLAPATSRIEDRYGVSIRTGGFAASAGFVVRLGAPVPR
jgi:hypothetical protein